MSRIIARTDYLIFSTPDSGAELLLNACACPLAAPARQWKVASGSSYFSRVSNSFPRKYNELSLTCTYSLSDDSRALFRVRGWLRLSPFSPAWKIIAPPREGGDHPAQTRAFFREQLRARRSADVLDWPDTLLVEYSCESEIDEAALLAWITHGISLAATICPLTASASLFPKTTHILPPLSETSAFTKSNRIALMNAFPTIGGAAPTVVGSTVSSLRELLEGLPSVGDSPRSTCSIVKLPISRELPILRATELEQVDDWVSRAGGDLIGGTAVFSVSKAKTLRQTGLLEEVSSGSTAVSFLLPEHCSDVENLPEIVLPKAVLPLIRARVEANLVSGMDIVDAHSAAFISYGFRLDLISKMAELTRQTSPAPP